MKKPHPILLLTALLLLLTSCRHNSDKSDALYYELKQSYKEARDSRKNGNAAHASRTLETLFRRLPVQDTGNDSIRRLTQEAVAEYFSAILTDKDPTPGLHFFDSLNALTPTPYVLRECRYDICAISSYFSLTLRDNERSEALLDSFLRMPDPPETWRLIKYNEMAASVCSSLRSSEESIRLMEKAVAAYRAEDTAVSMGPSISIGRMFAWLGNYYRMNNRYEDAMHINEEAIEYYQTHPEDYSTIIAYGEQSNIYHILEMYDKALDMNAKSIAAARRNSNYNLGDALNNRGNIFYDLHQMDSTLYYYHKGREASVVQKGLHAAIGSDLLLAYAYCQIPDSAHRAVTLLEPLLPDTARMPLWIKEDLKAKMGQALLANGNPVAAIPLLKSAASGQRQLGIQENETETYTSLMKAYRAAGQTDLFMAHYPYDTQLQDSLQKKKNLRSIAIASVRFDARQKEQENRLLTAEVDLKNSRLQSFVLIGLFLLAIGLGVGAWLWMRLRLKEHEKQLSQQQLREQSERLKQLIASRQELNNHNEELLRQLAEVQSTHEKTCDLDRVMESLQPRLLTNEEEEQFRTAFASLYPTVLHRLRSICPRATRTDELLCMLIVLKQTNEEISRTLGISRSSVLQNRYRLRSKLNLPEDSNLDTEVNRLLMN